MKNVKSIQLVEKAIKELSFSDQNGQNGKELKIILERMKRESNYREGTASQINNDYTQESPYLRALSRDEALKALSFIDREIEKLNADINRGTKKSSDIMNLMD